MTATPEIGPQQVHVPEHELDDLRDRLRRARLPEAETLTHPPGGLDWSQGPPRSYVAELVRYWAQDYDWRRVESELNAAGPARTTIDGLDIHFLHVRSQRADARPLVITHGWPGSVIESLDVLADLVAPPEDQPAFHVVVPSLPGFGFSGKPSAPGWTVARTADAWAELMHRLGYRHFFAAGGDWGGRVTVALANRHPARVSGLHTFSPYLAPDLIPDGTDGLSDAETAGVEQTRSFWSTGGGYSLEHSTRPQAIGYSLVDSPVGLLTWILDKLALWTDWQNGVEEALGRDRILDMISLYWLTATGASAARFYWQNFPPDNAGVVTVPTGVTVFPADIEKLPRSWVEARFANLRYWHVAERGGHFPMLEVPASFVAEVRRALGPLPG